jgi:hypothetical protein
MNNPRLPPRPGLEPDHLPFGFPAEWEKLGLTVSDDELVDMVQGDNVGISISPTQTASSIKPGFRYQNRYAAS